MAQKTTLQHRAPSSQGRGGRAPRGRVTSRQNQTATQPEAPEMAAVGSDQMAADIVALPAPRRGGNLFAASAADTRRKVADKLNLLGSVRQLLAEAADLFSAGAKEADKATEVADRAGVRLYQARVNALLSAEEVSATLGDIFGFKNKADGSPGKTPNGQGEAIRKRVVRAAQAYEYVTNGDGGRFFEDVPEDKVSQVLTELDNGSVGFWAAYERFAAIKREAAGARINPAFDPKRVAGLVEALSEDGAAKIIRSSPSLIAAYGALIDVLNVIGAEPEKKAA